MNKLIKTFAIFALVLVGGSLFGYNGGYENSLLTDTTIGGVTYTGYGNNTVTAREASETVATGVRALSATGRRSARRRSSERRWC